MKWEILSDKLFLIGVSEGKEEENGAEPVFWEIIGLFLNWREVSVYSSWE